MPVERKLLTHKKEEKQKSLAPAPKKIKRSVKIEQFPDAIVDGKFVGTVGSNLIIQRFRNGKNVLCACKVLKINDDGLIDTFDETSGQCYSFPVDAKMVGCVKLAPSDNSVAL